jgi:hypothetical protein
MDRAGDEADARRDKPDDGENDRHPAVDLRQTTSQHTTPGVVLKRRLWA